MGFLNVLGNFLGTGGGGGSGLSAGVGLSNSKSNSDTSGTSNTVNTAFDAQSKTQLDDFLSQLLEGASAQGTDYSKANAVKDISSSVDQIFKQYRETSLPQIFQQMGSAGIYNSTGAQAMADNAYGQAVGQAAALTHQSVLDYAKLVQDKNSTNLQAILSAFGLEKDAYQTSNANATSSTTTKSSTKKLDLGLKLGG